MTDERLPRPDDFRTGCEVDVRFRDLDAMGHVNNAVYATYFEIARMHYVQALCQLASDEPGFAECFSFILLDVYCRFLEPVGFGDRLRVWIRTSRIGTTSFDFEYLVTSDRTGRAVAYGRSTQVYYDYGAHRAVPIPNDVRHAIVSFDDPETA
jgi:acyl-CoA thioester hydrolase